MVTTVLRRQVYSSGAFLHSKVKEYLLKDRSVCCTADTGHCTQGQCRPQVICLPMGQENFVQMIIYKHMESSTAQAEYINMHPLLLPCSLPFFILPSLPFFSYCCSLFFFPELAKSISYTYPVWPPLIEPCSVLVVTIKMKNIPSV